MTTSTHILGIDIGTTSTKTILFAASGKVIVDRTVNYPLLSPQPEVQEQDPEEIYEAVTRSAREVIEQAGCKANLAGIAFSTAMHTLIAVDADGAPLTRSITWADRRSAPWVDKIRQQCDTHALYGRTGVPLHPMLPLVKLLWLKAEQPKVFEQAAKFISIKEYILHRWFGQFVVDHSIANATGLFNINSLDWDEEALSLAKISADRLSELVPTTHVLKGMTEAAATALGLPAETPVVVGASDGALANLGVGAIAPGEVTVTVGTSGAVRASAEQPQTDPKERLFCYALTEKRWVIGGATNNGGIVLRWVRDHLADAEVDTANLLQTDPYNILTDIAATVPAGSEGLIFHPYLAGERAPLWDANARGSFFGLALHHTKAHMIRAILEGIVYNLNVILAAVEDVAGETKGIHATGGMVRSELWRQMLADVFDQTILIPETFESSCLGAAMLGLYALGHLDNLEDGMAMLGEAESHPPNAEAAQHYRALLPLYDKLLAQVRPLYEGLAEL
ncbi:MAG: gluconokinase [Elainellaceae cyanobacterium]